MSSITISEPLARLRKLNLVFKRRYYEVRSLRGSFVRVMKHPIDAILTIREPLHVLKDISLDVNRGDRLAIIGVNGSGKTTLCRCLAGILRPDQGEVTVNGSCRAVFNAQVGVIPQLTGEENALLLARLVYPEENENALRTLAEEAMNFSELGHHLKAPFETYSQGMKARLCVSVMTARSSDLLILDEVYDSTDQFFQQRMTSRLMDCIDQSQSVVFVSHSPELIRRICNRGVVLQGSRIAYDGPVDKALRAYEFLNAPLSPPEMATAVDRSSSELI